MKIKSIAIAAAAGLAVVMSSCVVNPMGGYNTVSYSTNGYGSTVAWTNASYDANGFPIYGYSYGRPVYGYTAAGAAIFTIAALTALCYVPDWGPAPWYHGHHHYPPHIHRVPKPPRYAPGHAPHHRPSGGMNAPIHRNPHSVLGSKPGHRPSPNHHSAPAGRPGAHHSAPAGRPSGNVGRPSNHGRPNVNVRPSGGSRPSAASRPSGGSRPNVHARPSGGSRPSEHARPSGGSRPSAASRPAGGSRPSGGLHGAARAARRR